MAGFCLGIAMAFMGLALALHLDRAHLSEKFVPKPVYICSNIISGKHILPIHARPAFCLDVNDLRTKNLPAKSPHIQNVTIVNLCLVHRTFILRP